MIMLVYDLTKKFSREEVYGITSQLRRAIISIMLNFVEGHARFKTGVKIQFFETAYGSSKECKYLIFFCLKRNWINTEEYKKAISLLDEAGAMLWSLIIGLEKNKETKK
ncbi:MAG: four helix bundle protein [Candidatus Magasanikbacteria bacterium]|nr:four helix bundle protein [Candidatus Magasanikbacteria bacterium]